MSPVQLTPPDAPKRERLVASVSVNRALSNVIYGRQKEMLLHLPRRAVKAAFHDTDTDILARMTESVSMSVSWNAALTK